MRTPKHGFDMAAQWLALSSPYYMCHPGHESTVSHYYNSRTCGDKCVVMSFDQSNWMTLREAAAALSVSELTIRRRIKSGSVEHRLVDGKYLIDISSFARRSARSVAPDNGAGEHVPTPESFRPASEAGREQRTRSEHDTGRAIKSRAVRRNGDAETKHVAPAGSSSTVDIDALLAQLARLAEEAGRARLLEEQLAHITERHDALYQDMTVLANRNGWLQGKLEERESDLKLLENGRRSSPWWKRLFGA